MRIPHYIHMYTYIYPAIYIHVVYIPHNNPLFNKDIERSFVRMVFSFPFFNNRSAPFIFTCRIVHVLDLDHPEDHWNHALRGMYQEIFILIYIAICCASKLIIYTIQHELLCGMFSCIHIICIYIMYIYPLEIGDCYTSGIRI